MYLMTHPYFVLDDYFPSFHSLHGMYLNLSSQPLFQQKLVLE